MIKMYIYLCKDERKVVSKIYEQKNLEVDTYRIFFFFKYKNLKRYANENQRK